MGSFFAVLNGFIESKSVGDLAATHSTTASGKQ